MPLQCGVARIGQEWRSVTEHPNFIPPLPFEPIVLEEARLETYISNVRSTIRLRQSLKPKVARKQATNGGRIQGQWSRKYHYSRNDPNRHGVSDCRPTSTTATFHPSE